MAVIDPTSGSGGSGKTNQPTAERATGLDRNAFLQLLAAGQGEDESSEASDAQDADADEDEVRKDKEAVS